LLQNVTKTKITWGEDGAWKVTEATRKE